MSDEPRDDFERLMAIIAPRPRELDAYWITQTAHTLGHEIRKDRRGPSYFWRCSCGEYGDVGKRDNVRLSLAANAHRMLAVEQGTGIPLTAIAERRIARSRSR